MRESPLFSFLCQCLQQFDKKRHLSQQHKALQNLKPDWYLVTSLADSHYVLPSLFYQLKEKSLLQFLRKRLTNPICSIIIPCVMMGHPETIIKEDAHDTPIQPEQPILPEKSLAGPCQHVEQEWPQSSRVLQAT